MVAVKSSLRGTEQLRKVVDETLKRGGNLQGVAEVVAEELVAAVEQNFQDERGFQQGAWQELADSTKARRREAAEHKILQDTTVLAGSITPAHQGLEAEAFTDVPYAIFHVSEEPRSVIPLRDFLDVDLEGIADTTSDLILAEFA
jgi:phage gpG-like protein